MSNRKSLLTRIPSEFERAQLERMAGGENPALRARALAVLAYLRPETTWNDLEKESGLSRAAVRRSLRVFAQGSVEALRADPRVRRRPRRPRVPAPVGLGTWNGRREWIRRLDRGVLDRGTPEVCWLGEMLGYCEVATVAWVFPTWFLLVNSEETRRELLRLVAELPKPGSRAYSFAVARVAVLLQLSEEEFEHVDLLRRRLSAQGFWHQPVWIFVAPRLEELLQQRVAWLTETPVDGHDAEAVAELRRELPWVPLPSTPRVGSLSLQKTLDDLDDAS